ncbi:MAG: endonuclease domain-containing protein [Pseudomonadota bacterium]
MNDTPFIFKRYAFNFDTAILNLEYAFENGPAFEEKINFIKCNHILDLKDKAALDQCFKLLFLFAGVSYYKAYSPTTLKCEAFELDSVTATFIEKVYRHGLGEFSYTNKIDLSQRLQFLSSPTALPQPATKLNLQTHLLIPVGGGKDSIVTIETLKLTQKPLSLFALGTPSGIATPIIDTAAVSELPLVTVERSLSPELFKLNKQGAYNGHIPITAILSTIAIASAILNGFNTVVMSNEHSASAPNIHYNGLDINHQYSKSFEFERDFSHYVSTYISPDLHYFSFLRPLSEANITRRFAKLNKYHSVFRSCNTAFRQDASLRGKHWCCNCPKCRFIFLALAPFLGKPQLIEIFGHNLLNDNTQYEGFAELCGLSAHKPFECVGEIEESALLIQKLSTHTEWRNDAIVEKIGQQLNSQPSEQLKFEERFQYLFAIKEPHHVPPDYLRMLCADQ